MLKKWVGLKSLLPAVALSLGLVVLGCSSGGTKAESPATSDATVATTSNLPASSTTEPDTVSPGPGPSAAEMLARGLYMFRFEVSWSYEPCGDVPDSILIFALISKVAPDASTVTFDAVQVYVGSGVTGDWQGEGYGYTRNDIEHAQTLPLAADAAILLQGSALSYDPNLQQLESSNFQDRSNDLVAATPLQFAQLAKSKPDYQGHPEFFGYFWVFVDGGKITGILEPYME